MDKSFGSERKQYPVSLQCAAEAVFGPDERLMRLLRKPRPDAKDDERNRFADGVAAMATEKLRP